MFQLKLIQDMLGRGNVTQTLTLTLGYTNLKWQ